MKPHKDHVDLPAIAVACILAASCVALCLAGAAPGAQAGVIACSFEAFDQTVLQPGEKQALRFEVGDLPPGKEAVLSLRARVDQPKSGGYSHALRIRLNGRILETGRLMNKERIMECGNGLFYPMAYVYVFTVFRGPDFRSVDGDMAYGLKLAKASAFELRVTDLLNKGINTLTIENAAPSGQDCRLVAASETVDFRSPTVQLPPSGPLPVVLPNTDRTDHSAYLHPTNDIQVRVPGARFLVESRFSTPEPAWQKTSNPYFSLVRQVTTTPEDIIVTDRMTNLTDENLPVMRRHTVRLLGMTKAWLGGRLRRASPTAAAVMENPTSYGVTATRGIGLLPMEDAFQVHIANSLDKDRIGIEDNQFVLKPRATYVSTWAIIPTTTPDYWAFINAARRLLNVNFTVDGPGVFIHYRPESLERMTDQEIIDVANNKSARYLENSMLWPYYGSLRTPHSTIYATLDHRYEKAQLARARSLAPQAKNLVYFDCMQELVDERWPLYPDARVLGPDGVQYTYLGPPDSNMKLFFPTDTNTFGRDMARNVDVMLDDVGYDGIYWDETDYSAVNTMYHYGEPWDGVSADIDRRTMRITRLKSSITLLSQNYRIALAKRMLAHGPVIGNGAPCTRSMAQLHFPRHTETGSWSCITSSHLYSPIALGMHIVETNESDCYYFMRRFLDYGNLYYWYWEAIRPTHKMLTEYMYPFTPIELHEGYLIGEERILTNRSGLYGWGDRSEHQVHVFDSKGWEVPGYQAPTVVRDGSTFTELRIADGWSAAIVRVRN